MSLKAALYCRISSEENHKENESIQNQKLILEDYAQKKHWNIYKIYIDDDFSGMDKDRPAFKEMINDAKERKFDIILCKSQSRFTRDIEVLEEYIHNKFILWKIRFISIVDNADTDIASNKKMRQLNGLINEWYCEEISENIKAVFKKKMELGQFLGPYAPYGYKKDKKDKHKLIPDKKTAPIVKEIYNMYIRGMSYKKIAQSLTKKGIDTPSFYKKSLGIDKKHNNSIKNIWSENTIAKILKNQTYTGCVVQGREKKLSYISIKVVSVPFDEWIISKKVNPEIIDDVTFEKVQKIIKNKSNF